MYKYCNKDPVCPILWNGERKKVRVEPDGRIGVGFKSKKNYPIGRAVYSLFIGEIPEGMTVDHIDGNHWNNRLENLQLLTLKDNYFKEVAVRSVWGYVGVCKRHKGGYKASYRRNNKRIYKYAKCPHWLAQWYNERVIESGDIDWLNDTPYLSEVYKERIGYQKSIMIKKA